MDSKHFYASRLGHLDSNNQLIFHGFFTLSQGPLQPPHERFHIRVDPDVDGNMVPEPVAVEIVLPLSNPHNLQDTRQQLVNLVVSQNLGPLR